MNNNYQKIITFSLISYLILNIFTNMFRIFPITQYYRLLLVIEITVLILVIFTREKLLIQKNESKKIFIIILIQIFAYLMTNLIENYTCFDIHRLLTFILMIVIFYIIPLNSEISIKYFKKILNGILIVGIIATIYNYYMNASIINTLNISKIMLYTSNFSSFFNTRSNYCLLLCFCCVVCLSKLKKNYFLYISLYLYFFANIVLTNARTSIVAILIISIISIWNNGNKKIKRPIIIVGSILLIVFMPWNKIFGDFKGFMQEYTLLFTRGDDFSNGRSTLWLLAINDTNMISFFIGHGIGAKDAYLSSINSPVLSFHNMYFDLFYEGGIILILILISYVRKVVYEIKNSLLNKNMKRLFIDLFYVVGLSGIGDAIATPFTLDTSSILTSTLLFACPLCLINYVNNKKEE